MAPLSTTACGTQRIRRTKNLSHLHIWDHHQGGNKGRSPGAVPRLSLRLPALFLLSIFRNTVRHAQSAPLRAMSRCQDATLRAAKFQSPASKQVLDAETSRSAAWGPALSSLSALPSISSGSPLGGGGRPSLHGLPNISRPPHFLPSVMLLQLSSPSSRDTTCQRPDPSSLECGEQRLVSLGPVSPTPVYRPPP